MQSSGQICCIRCWSTGMMEWYKCCFEAPLWCAWCIGAFDLDTSCSVIFHDATLYNHFRQLRRCTVQCSPDDALWGEDITVRRQGCTNCDVRNWMLMRSTNIQRRPLNSVMQWAEWSGYRAACSQPSGRPTSWAQGSQHIQEGGGWLGGCTLHSMFDFYEAYFNTEVVKKNCFFKQDSLPPNTHTWWSLHMTVE